jgi:heptosyltransferase I
MWLISISSYTMTLPFKFTTRLVKSMPRNYPSAPESICVLRLSAIGDCCHTLPVVRTLQTAFPQTPITWVINKTEFRLLQGAEGIEFITFDKNAGWAGLNSIRKQMAGKQYPVLLHMNASIRANLVSAVIPAQRRIGFDRKRARDFQWAFSNECIAEQNPARRHVLDGLFQFAEHLGVTERTMRWDIPVTPADKQFAAEVANGPGPVCVISPCSSQRARNYRNWNIDNFVKLTQSLQKEYGAQVILTGAATEMEKHYGVEILARTQGITNLIGATTLKQLFALISKADLVICPDSGPAHMATAAGTHVVGLYSSSNPERTGPYNDLQLTVNKYPEAVQKEFGKAVSEVGFGQRVRNPQAMDLITVADVMQKVAIALGKD